MLKSHRWLVGTAVVGVLALAAFAGALKPLARLVETVTLPVARVLSSARNTVIGLGQQTISSDAEQRIMRLESLVRSLAMDQAHIEGLEEENRQLRALAKFIGTSGYDSVGAHVISRDIRNQQALILIDRGQRDGLEVGQAVVSAGGILIGRISVLKDRVATVELVTDPRARIAAALRGKLIGVVEGRGNGAATLTYIPPSQVIARDEILTTAGVEEKIPADLPFAIVNDVHGKPTDPFLKASLEPLVPFDRLTLVSVLRPSVLRPDL